MNKTLYVIRKDYYDAFMKKWTKLSKKRNHKDCHYSLLMYTTSMDEYNQFVNSDPYPESLRQPVPDIDKFVTLVMTHE